MSDKYIIKNCNVIFKNGDFYFCQSSENLAKNVYCRDCTDCILKQIVEKCKLFQNNYLVNDGVQLLTTNILNSLDIQECE